MIQNQVKDAAAKLVTGIHRAVFTASGGRVGGRVLGMPVVMLTTTGRKSGKWRTTMLTSPVQDGDTVVLVASYGGDNRHPTWYLNLRDDPDVEVTIHSHHRRMRARVATPEERDALWPRIVEVYQDYGNYQKRTTREIPVVILEPRP